MPKRNRRFLLGVFPCSWPNFAGLHLRGICLVIHLSDHENSFSAPAFVETRIVSRLRERVMYRYISMGLCMIRHTSIEIQPFGC
jgi:hypothetical protein